MYTYISYNLQLFKDVIGIVYNLMLLLELLNFQITTRNLY